MGEIYSERARCIFLLLFECVGSGLGVWSGRVVISVGLGFGCVVDLGLCLCLLFWFKG